MRNAPVRLISHIVDQLDLTLVMDSYSCGGGSCYSPDVAQGVVL